MGRGVHSELSGSVYFVGMAHCVGLKGRKLQDVWGCGFTA